MLPNSNKQGQEVSLSHFHHLLGTSVKVELEQGKTFSSFEPVRGSAIELKPRSIFPISSPKPKQIVKLSSRLAFSILESKLVSFGKI